jgi:hypothetical protein
MRDRSTQPYLDRQITWRGVGAAYGLMLLVLAVLWAISYPIVAATLLVFAVGIYVMVRVSAQRTVCIPTTDTCITV